MLIRSILLMLRGFEQGATRKSVGKAVGLDEGTVARYYARFKAEGFKKGLNSGWDHSRPNFYGGPDIIGKPAHAKEATKAGTGSAKVTLYKGQAKG